MSGEAIPRLMKWLTAARLGMRWPQVMSTPTGRRGTRRLIWPSSCLRLLFTSARLANGRPTPKVLKMWRLVMLLLLLVPGSRSRFTKLRGLLIAGDVLDANEYAPNNSTLAALRRRACVPLFGAALGATPSLPRVHLSRSRGAPCAGHTAETAALRCVKVAQAHVPLTQGASVLVAGCTSAFVRSFVRALLFVCWH